MRVIFLYYCYMYSKVVPEVHKIPSKPKRPVLSRPSYTCTAHQAGYSLIELLVVVGIIGILSMIAIPNYHNHVGRTQFTKAMNFAATHRVSIEDLIFNIGKFPEGDAGLIDVFGELIVDQDKDKDKNAVTFARLELIKQISLTSDKNNNLNGTLVLELEPDEANTKGVNTGIRGKKITFTRANAMWACTTDAPKKLVPKGCKSTV